MTRPTWAMTRGVVATIAAAILFLVAAGAAALLEHTEALRAGDWSMHTLTVLEQAQRLLASVTDTETGQRGFVLTGKESYLEPYHRGVSQIPDQLAGLRASVRDDPSQQARLGRLEPLITRKVAEVDATIRARRAKGPGAALAIIETDAGKRTMDAIRGELAGFQAEESASLRDRLAERTRRGTRARRLIMAGIFGALGFGAASFGLIESSSRRRMRAERALAESEERLRVTMRSIGDAVIATDVDGRVVFMNPIAESLTGWPMADAAGRHLDDVFSIVNETTRAPVESPVAKVLRTSGIVGLANHTVLVARDGRRVPIDDSGAPIRYDDGTVMGVVLVFRDVTDRKEAEAAQERLVRAEVARERAEDALADREQARAAAESANVEKDRFLALLSHELRSPLNAMMGWLAVLKRRPDREQLGRAVTTLERNVHLQAQLVNDLLDVSRIVSGKLAIEKEPTAFAPVLLAAVESMRPAAAAKGVTLELVGDGLSGIIVGDAKRLGQAVSNILTNAVKFTAAGGRIEVELRELDGEAMLRVTDSGLGIAPDFLPHVFDRFRQADSSTTRAHGGLGLGLYIVKSIVEMHGGRVVAESEGTGRGARFTIRLPLVAVGPALPATDGRPAAPATLIGTTVLLVEDDVDTRDALALTLETCGARVLAAGSGAEARAVIARGVPDVIVSDIGMPGESGYDLMRAVRAGDDNGIPAIALTGFASRQDREDALDAGFAAHLPKPILPEVLVATIRDVLRRA